jgi:hypothetical protein
MQEQRSEPGTSEGRITQRLYPPAGTRTSEAPPRNDHTRVLAFVLIGLGLAMLASNVAQLPWEQGRERTYEVTAPLEDATVARVRFEWGSGSLRLGTAPGSDELVWGSADATRALVVDARDYENDDEQGTDVAVRPRSMGWFGGFSSASSTLLLNEQPRYDLLVFDLESGSANLDLSQLDVRELKLDAGSGSVEMQLPSRGATEGEFDVGSGSLNMMLPPDVEARIVLDKGNGSFSAGDRLKLVEEGENAVYQTPNYDEDAEQRIELDIEGGSGSIVIN